jgi:predicted dehydrogenase
MRERLRVAIAGCHRQVMRQPGSHNWAVAFDAVPDTEIVAVFDLGAEARDAFVACWQSEGRPIAAYADYEQMLREVRPDMVCVATRQTMHARQIELAVDAGVRGILCDKPLAISLAEVDRIVAVCQNAKVALAFGLDRRWTTRYRFARTLIAEGAVGRVTAVTAYALQNLINHGCHWYDAALSLAGDPDIEWVSGFVDDVSQEPPTSNRRLDPSGRAQIGLSTPDGEVAMYVTPDGKPGLSFEVIGDRGRLLLLNDARDAYLWQLDGATPPSLKPHSLEVPTTAEPWEAGPGAVADLVHAIRSGGATACDAPEALRASTIGFAIHASSAAGGKRLRVSEVDRTLEVPSFLWGNE